MCCRLCEESASQRAHDPQLGVREIIACLRTANVQTDVEWDDLWYVPESYVRRPDQIVHEKDILISTANSQELVGKVSLVRHMPARSTLGAFIALIRAPQPLDPRFAYYQIASPTIQAALRGASSTTTNISNISTRSLKATALSIAPLPEQRRIVEKIEALFSELDAGVAALERAQALLGRYRQSVLKAAFEGKLTARWREAHKDELEPASELLERIKAERDKAQAGSKRRRKPLPPLDTSDLPDLPEGWCWARLDQLAACEPNSITDGPFGSKLKTAHYTESGPRVIRLQNIGAGEFVDAEAHISGEHFLNLLKHEVTNGDLVIAALGADVPRACMVPPHICPAIVKADCIKFRPHPLYFDRRYLLWALNSNIPKEYAKRIIHGVGRPRLNQQQIRSLPLPIPGRQEQERIAEEVTMRFALNAERECAVIEALHRASALRQSILKRAFEGKLVLQDPNDEPATVLLERIRAEKAAREAETKAARSARRPRRQRKAKKTKTGNEPVQGDLL